MIKAAFRGGPRDGQVLELAEAPLELVVDGVRYVVGLVDKHEVRHYYVPAVRQGISARGKLPVESTPGVDTGEPILRRPVPKGSA